MSLTFYLAYCRAWLFVRLCFLSWSDEGLSIFLCAEKSHVELLFLFSSDSFFALSCPLDCQVLLILAHDQLVLYFELAGY